MKKWSFAYWRESLSIIYLKEILLINLNISFIFQYYFLTTIRSPEAPCFRDVFEIPPISYLYFLINWIVDQATNQKNTLILQWKLINNYNIEIFSVRDQLLHRQPGAGRCHHRTVRHPFPIPGGPSTTMELARFHVPFLSLFPGKYELPPKFEMKLNLPITRCLHFNREKDLFLSIFILKWNLK